jgi:glycosyltransferase involved in cell wall biosynthesis
MNQELVSVVIPTCNRASSVERAIDSVLAQTHQALDIIVVDDGSTDDTAERMVRRYGNDSRVRYLRQSNQGVSAARNTGLAAVRGAYVALLDSDDTWKPWKIEVQLCCLRAVPEAGMIWTDMQAADANGNIISPHYLRTMYSAAYRWFPEETLFQKSRLFAKVCPQFASHEPNRRLYWGDIYSQMVMGNMVHTSTVLLRRERLARVGGFNESLKFSGEDYDFHLRTCREGPVAFVNISSILYQTGRMDQLTSRKYAIHMARNFLTTITSALADSRHRIDLPPYMIARVQAFAHAWIGAEHLELGEHESARRHMRQSLNHRHLQPKLWVLYVLSLLPHIMYQYAVTRLRVTKRVLKVFFSE